jgi:hypothetical protein
VTHVPELTGYQQGQIDAARKLTGLHGVQAVREHTGDSDYGMAYAVAFGQAQWAIGDLLAIIAELAGKA